MGFDRPFQVPFCKGYKDKGGLSATSFLAETATGGLEDYQVDCHNAVGYMAVYR